MTGRAARVAILFVATILGSGCAISPEALGRFQARVFGHGLQQGESVERVEAGRLHTVTHAARIATHSDPYQGSVGSLTVENRAEHRVYLIGAFIPGLGLGYLEETVGRGTRVVDAIPLEPGERVSLDGERIRLRFDWPASYAHGDGEAVAGYAVVRIGECMRMPGCVLGEPATFSLGKPGSVQVASR